MSNPIFSALGSMSMFGNMQNFMNQFNQFRSTFQGDPQQTINQMLQNGKITQDQVNQAKQMADELQRMMK